MSICLDVLKYEDMEKIRKWRNEISKSGYFRTPYLLTEKMQEDFFNNVINNRNANSRYFGIFQEQMRTLKTFVGYCGLDKIEWENGIAEIGLMLNPVEVKKGYGSKAVNLLLNEAFYNMRLQNIYGECYKCNTNIRFWEKMIKKYNGYKTILPARKYFDGRFYDSLYFNFNVFDFKGEK